LTQTKTMTDVQDHNAALRRALEFQSKGRIGHIETRAAIKRARELLTIIDALILRNDVGQARSRLRELARAVAAAGEHLNTSGNNFSRTRRWLERIVDETRGGQ
jgi:hypothetical protein